MSGKALWKLHADPEFQRLAMPMPDRERQALDADILSNRRREPVAVWHRTIIEGYQRYQIYMHYGIKFALEETVFPSKTHAIIWVCRRQLECGKLTKTARWYLLGRLCFAEKGGTPESTFAQTSERLQEEYGVSYGSLRRYRTFTNKLDCLRSRDPELAEGILSGKYRVDKSKFTYLEQRNIQELRMLARQGTSMKPFDSLPCATSRSVKDMPAFDPDGPPTSLALTIPSWVGILEQASAKSSFSEASLTCRDKLEQALLSLYAATETVLTALWED